MHQRLKEGRPIHVRDPLFAALFANGQKITMKVEPTKKGVRVAETSTDRYVTKLIQAHAEVVSKFAANGFPEALHSITPVRFHDVLEDSRRYGDAVFLALPSRWQ
jgi:hypothetical protein